MTLWSKEFLPKLATALRCILARIVLENRAIQNTKASYSNPSPRAHIGKYAYPAFTLFNSGVKPPPIQKYGRASAASNSNAAIPQGLRHTANAARRYYKGKLK